MMDDDLPSSSSHRIVSARRHSGAWAKLLVMEASTAEGIDAQFASLDQEAAPSGA
jgi:hypothetical protein